MSAAKKKQDKPTIVKKYANRRLYDTGRSSYVTLEDLYDMVKEGHDFVVVDAKTGEDLTKPVLTQIIVEKESKGENVLPLNFLKQIIGFYGDAMQPLLPNYLEQSLENFVQHQEDLREQMTKSLSGGMMPLQMMEEMTRQNMAMFQNTLNAFAGMTTKTKKDD
ncbi:MAG: polyhydroxyalkanoate synthesis repressor PhaR [Alphaproteobacteria bacterium]|nr:polyhydroxyalkanoate synthesis repressor PhaR [Alphaproteobacteria bacterium]